ncbi:hypothetical protein N7470_003659 [Penicillium chermesinum]|nr:hypothetical protein N7470_003659 [Penicillium chermesinum]
MAVPADKSPMDDSHFADAEKELSNDKLAGFEDPDAGLSEEERAKLVCNPSIVTCSPAAETQRNAIKCTTNAGTNSRFTLPGSPAGLETRYTNGSLAQSPLSGLVPGSDLKMSPNEYNNTLTIFFASYAVFEPLTNVLLKRLRPSIFIPSIMIAWVRTPSEPSSRQRRIESVSDGYWRFQGICMTLMGVVHNYAGLMAVRFFLGLCEAGLFPGVGYFLSCWYKRSEFGVRFAIFFSAAALAGSFGGLLAAAISKMDGIGGKAGWAWIFILEGLATFVIGVASFWCVYDFPDQAKFLSPDDRARVLRRLALDQQSSAEHEEFKMKYLWASLKDWKTYTGAIIYMGADGALYAFSLFTPTIINELVSISFA